MMPTTTSQSGAGRYICGTDAVKRAASQICRSAVQRWEGLCSGEAIPRPDQLDLLSVSDDLSPLLVVSVERADAQTVFRYRHVSNREVALRRSDPTGRRVDEAFFGPSRDDVLAFYQRAVDTAAPILDPEAWVTESGIVIRDETLLLPFGENGVVQMILVYCNGLNRIGPPKPVSG